MSDWFEPGLPFRCTGCGDCCSGAPGVVWLSDDDAAAIASFLGLDADELERGFLRRVAGRRALLERFNGDCVFFDAEARGCRIYPARPVQCRTFPFWEQNLASPRAWADAARECEGIRPDADLVPAEAIRERARAFRRAREES